jgi:acyl-coenzyme A synthetase/AMP-(fatty) acid ligase
LAELSGYAELLDCLTRNSVELLDALPKSPVGKILRKEWRT